MSDPKRRRITVVSEHGSVDYHDFCKLIILLLLGGLSLAAALAVNDTVKYLLGLYCCRDCISGYILYTAVAILLVVIVAYFACLYYPDLTEYIDLTPI